MEIKISDKTEQPLLSRTELTGVISFDSATPSRVEVTKKIAESMKADLALVTVSSIDTNFGQKSAKVIAHIYKTKEDLDKYVSKTVKQRYAPKKSKGTEEPAPEEKKQVAPKKDEKATDTKAPKKDAAENKKPEAPKKESADKKPEGAK